MKQRPDVLKVVARLSSWFLVLALLQVTELSVLAHVTFPSDSSLKISLPEWQPADRASRAAEWKRARPQYGQSRRGEAGRQGGGEAGGEGSGEGGEGGEGADEILIVSPLSTDMLSLDKCPDFQLMSPCQCRERTSGLDITCENVETGQLRAVTENMKKYKEQQDFTVRDSAGLRSF